VTDRGARMVGPQVTPAVGPWALLVRVAKLAMRRAARADRPPGEQPRPMPPRPGSWRPRLHAGRAADEAGARPVRRRPSADLALAGGDLEPAGDGVHPSMPASMLSGSPWKRCGTCVHAHSSLDGDSARSVPDGSLLTPLGSRTPWSAPRIPHPCRSGAPIPRPTRDRAEGRRVPGRQAAERRGGQPTHPDESAHRRSIPRADARCHGATGVPRLPAGLKGSTART
jgi:hypothetical protein